MYFDDDEYNIFIKDVDKLISNKDYFIQKYLEINNIKKDVNIC